MNAMSSFLRSIGSDTNPDQILGTLDKVRSQVQKARTKILSADEVAEVTEGVDESIQSVILLRQDIERMNSLLNLYQANADRNLPNIERLIDISVVDYKTAFDATQAYSKEWFSNAFFSEEAKVELADYILTAVQRYCSDNLETLTMISERNNDIMQYIRYPREEDS